MDNKEHPMLYLLYGDKDKYDKEWLKCFCEIHEDYSKQKRPLAYLGSPRSNK